jgi:hypothetical protein
MELMSDTTATAAPPAMPDIALKNPQRPEHDDWELGDAEGAGRATILAAEPVPVMVDATVTGGML